MSVRTSVRPSVTIKEKPPGDASYCPPGLVFSVPLVLLSVLIVLLSVPLVLLSVPLVFLSVPLVLLSVPLVLLSVPLHPSFLILLLCFCPFCSCPSFCIDLLFLSFQLFMLLSLLSAQLDIVLVRRSYHRRHGGCFDRAGCPDS